MQKEGFQWTVTFIGNLGDLPLLETDATNMACSGSDQAVAAVEFIEGKANQFIVEPRKASGEPVKDLDAAAGFVGEDVFFTELWSSESTVINGSHAWDSDGGVATYNGVKYDIQTVSTSAGSAFTGSFQLKLDSRSYLSGIEDITETLAHNIQADDMKYALEKLQNVGTVDVARSANANNGYDWTVTFKTFLGDVSTLIRHSQSFTNGGSAGVTEIQKGVAEIQTIRNAGDTSFVREIQTITTYANNGQSVGG